MDAARGKISIAWESFADEFGKFDAEGNQPDWTTYFLPSDLVYISTQLTDLKDPSICASDLAVYSRNVNGTEIEKTLAYGNMVDPYYIDRYPKTSINRAIYELYVKEVLKRAVKETANAILWVLRQVDFEKEGLNDDLYPRRPDNCPPIENLIGIQQYYPTSVDLIMQRRNMPDWMVPTVDATDGYQGLTGLAAMQLIQVLPILALVFVPTVGFVIIDFLKKYN